LVLPEEESVRFAPRVGFTFKNKQICRHTRRLTNSTRSTTAHQSVLISPRVRTPSEGVRFWATSLSQVSCITVFAKSTSDCRKKINYIGRDYRKALCV